MQYIRKRKVRIGAWCDNEALRLAIKHGGSEGMEHMDNEDPEMGLD